MTGATDEDWRWRGVDGIPAAEPLNPRAPGWSEDSGARRSMWFGGAVSQQPGETVSLIGTVPPTMASAADAPAACPAVDDDDPDFVQTSTLFSVAPGPAEFACACELPGVHPRCTLASL